MRVAIHQPNYIPWCGYFAKMRACDYFIFLDDAEISPGQSYVYRSQIRNKHGLSWLSIPTHRHLHEFILHVTYADTKWPQKHLNKITDAYGRTPYFNDLIQVIEPIYRDPGDTLAAFNIRMIQTIAKFLSIKCHFEKSSVLCPVGSRDDRLISLTQIVGANTYISGKGGQNYQDPIKFKSAGIHLEIHEYKPVPYNQQYGGFIPGLSIIDALFNIGAETIRLLEYPEIA